MHKNLLHCRTNGSNFFYDVHELKYDDTKAIVQDIFIEYNHISWVCVNKYYPFNIYYSIKTRSSYEPTRYYECQDYNAIISNIDLLFDYSEKIDAGTYYEETKKITWKFCNDDHPLSQTKKISTIEYGP